MKQPIVIISSWGKGVSFTGVLRHIISSLGNRPVYLLALDQKGEVRVEGNITIIPAHCDGYEPRKAHLIFEVVSRIRPAAVFYYYDLFAAQFHFPSLVEIQRTLAPVVVYLPIDGTLCNIQPLFSAINFERLVFFTDASRNKFLSLAAEINNFKEHESLKTKCRVVPHGVDRTHFFPTEGGRAQAKRRAFPDQPQLWNAPVILNGNRPWQRKRLDLTLEGFARFLEMHEREVYLYLHLPNASDDDRKILKQKTAELGIEKTVVMRDSEWLSVEDLNAIYNACEVGINTAMGEGWGLISCEHAATGAAQIVTGDEQMRDIWQNSAVYAETKTVEKIWACPHVEFKVTNAEFVAQSLNSLFSDDKFLNERSHAGQLKMNDPRFDWKVIERQWMTIFNVFFEIGF